MPIVRLILVAFLIFCSPFCFCEAHTLAQKSLESVRQEMVDSTATLETVALFENLRQLGLSGKTLIGRQDPHQTSTPQKGLTDIKALTGKELGVWGHDFLDFAFEILGDETKKQNENDSKRQVAEHSRLLATKAYNAGIVNIFCWHLRDPEVGTFYTRHLTDEQKQKMFRSILPGGEYHDWYKNRLKEVASFAQDAKGQDGTLVPIIFRPFHEFDGDWFWWGSPYCTPEEYVDCWRFTVLFLRDELGVRNFLYAFSPDNRFQNEAEYLHRYPGDAFVDLVGYDNYHDFETGKIDAAAKKLEVISTYAEKHGKIAALTEVGYRRSPVPERLYTDYYGKALENPDLKIAFLMFWRQGKMLDPKSPLAENFIEFVDSPRIVLLPDVENMYHFSYPFTDLERKR